MERGSEIAQKACLLEGITQLLSITPGDFAVILHSDPDCANLVIRDFRAQDPTRFYCTNLEERHVVGGTSRGRLERALVEVTRERSPRAVFVVGSCVSSMLADDIGAICDAAGAGLDTRLVPIESEALRLYGQAEILDLVTGLMVELSDTGSRRRDDAVNLLGYPGGDKEARRVLGSVGIEVNAAPWFGSPAREWASLDAAALNVISDARLFGRLASIMRERHGIPSLEVEPPFGLAATEAFYSRVAERFGREGEIGEVLREPGQRARDAIASGRSGLEGLVLAYHVGGRKAFELDTVVREGLGLVTAFREMGFAVELLFQGAVEREARERIQGVLEGYGLDVPFHPVEDRVSVTARIRERGHDAIYCSDSLREEVAATGAGLIPIGTMKPGFDGVVENVRRLRALLEGRVGE